MHIEIQAPELERFMRDEIESGHFTSAEELLTEALHALREKNSPVFATAAETTQDARAVNLGPRKNLAQFLLESPFAGSDLDLERRQDYGRPVEL